MQKSWFIATRWIKNPPLGFLLFLFFLALYSYHAAPDVTWGDSGEFASVIRTLGISHPTGYPLYTLIGKCLVVLSPASPARTMNLFSAFCSALALWILYRLILLLLDHFSDLFEEVTGDWIRRWVALIGSALLGVSPVFISQSLITEVYSLSILMQISLWYLLLRWWKGQDTLKAFFFVLGLAFAHHLTILLFTPFFLFILLIGFRVLKRDQKDLAYAFPYLFPGVSLYLYILIRAATGPVLNWGDPSSLDRFLWMIRGGDFRGLLRFDAIFIYGFGVFEKIAWFHGFRLQEQFQRFWLLGLLGIVWVGASLLKKQKVRQNGIPLLWMTLSLFFGIFYFSFYMVGDREIFFTLTYPITVCLIAVGLGFLLKILREVIKAFWDISRWKKSPAFERLSMALPLALLTGGLFLTGCRNISRESARQDIGARVFGETLMNSVPSGSLILVGLSPEAPDNSIYPLWYQKWGLGRGKDVVVLSVNFFNSPWYRYQVPIERFWFPDRETLYARGLVGYEPGLGTAFVSPAHSSEAIALFLQKNEAYRSLYTLSWRPELTRYYQIELVKEIPVYPGTEPEEYQMFLPNDPRLFRLIPRKTPEEKGGQS